MACQTSAELLAYFRSECGLPTVNDELTDAAVYAYLTLAQQAVSRQVATIAPGSQVGAPELLTTADGGYTYQFASYPYGHAEVRESRTGELLVPGAEYDGNADFAQEGQTIRWTDGKSRTFGDGPYARYAAEPGEVDGSTEPTLKPASARVLVVYKALDMWATKGGYRDPQPYREQYNLLAWGQQGDPGILGALRTQYAFQGGYPGRTARVSNLAAWAAGQPEI